MRSDHLALSRKYRPQKFTDVIGQESIVTTLQNAIRLKRVAHAYLFCGSRGTGKTTLARVFAKALNCEQISEAIEPCGICPTCLSISSGRFLDVIEIDGASHRGIDDIREINETVGYATSQGKYKIFIIDEVHMLTKEAFNALLKTLEEPPENVKFFFATTEPHKLPSTIISRCQRFDLKRISENAIFQKLASIIQDLKVEVEDGALEILSSYAEGSLRDAESLLDQILCYKEDRISKELILNVLGVNSRDLFFQLDEAIEKEDYSFAFSFAQKIFESGKELSYFLDELVEHFRVLLLCILSSKALETVFIAPQDKIQYKKNAKNYTQEQCLYYLDFLLHRQQELSQTLYKRVMLEMIFLHLIKNRKRIAIDQIVKKLITLENSFDKHPREISITPPVTKQADPLPIVPTPKEKIDSPSAAPSTKIEPPPIEIKKDPSPIAENNISEQSRYDTILRFAAVELEGTLSINKGE